MTERDAPTEGLIGDRFDRAGFAENLANLLYDEAKQKATGRVVGLTGPWGSGKSQTLLYVQEVLDNKDVQKPLLVMRYNPWLFSGRENMIESFLESLSALMDDDKYKKQFPVLKTLKSDFDRIKEYYGGFIRKVASVDPRAKTAADVILGPSSLETQKKVWAKKLADNEVSAIVIIDELDRLTDEEIRAWCKSSSPSRISRPFHISSPTTRTASPRLWAGPI